MEEAKVLAVLSPVAERADAVLEELTAVAYLELAAGVG